MISKTMIEDPPKELQGKRIIDVVPKEDQLKSMAGSEDCLHLAVFTPRVRNEKSISLLIKFVIFYFP